MRVGARRDRSAKLRRAVAESEIALRRAQQNHGARQQKLLSCRLHGALKCDRVERLEIFCCLRRPGSTLEQPQCPVLALSCLKELPAGSGETFPRIVPEPTPV